MDRSIAFYLVTDTYSADSIGQYVPTQTRRLVYGRKNSVTRAEWNAAGELGIKPELEITMFAGDYAGEKTVQIEANGLTITYGIYRTYQRQNDDLELYLEWKVGDSNGTVITTTTSESVVITTESGGVNGTDQVNP